MSEEGLVSEAGPARPVDDATATQPKTGWRLKLSWWLIFPVFLVVWWIGGTKREGKLQLEALLAQSLTDSQAHRYSECLTASRQAIKLDPSSADAHNNAGWCAANLGQSDDGIQEVREALRLKPDMQLAQNNLAWMLRTKPAANAGPSKPLTPADAALQESLQHAQAGRYQQCVDSARRALQLMPGMAEAYNNAGFCDARMGKLDDSITNLREALKIKSDFTLASNNLSMVLAEKAKASGRGGAK